jgi:Actinobacteria/chloroflexi VLRF1 release factor
VPTPSLSPARTVDVAPARLRRWVIGFAERHGDFEVQASGDGCVLTARDGAVAILDPPFPPLRDGWSVDQPVDNFCAHACSSRTIAIVLVRLGGHAAGIFEAGELVTSKVGARQVHGRSAAGGWSQQRFARRREGQVKVALDAAITATAAVVLPRLPTLEAVVTGGDRTALRAVLGDARLAGLRSLVTARILDVPDPKAQVLRDSFRAATAVRVTIAEPTP